MPNSIGILRAVPLLRFTARRLTGHAERMHLILNSTNRDKVNLAATSHWQILFRLFRLFGLFLTGFGFVIAAHTQKLGDGIAPRQHERECGKGESRE